MSRDAQHLAADAAFLAGVVDNLYNCVAVTQAVRKDGKIVDFKCVFVNRAYLETLRTSREEILSKSLLARHPAFRESGLFASFVEVVETGELMDFEHHIQGDGLDLHVRLIVKKFGDGFLAAFHDIARRKRSETELKRLNLELEHRVAERTAELNEAQIHLQRALESAQQSNLAKGEFLAMVSHDLRSPLTAIQGYVGLLVSEGANKEQTEQLNVIDQCAEGLLRLLDDLLRFSRLEAGQFNLENEPFLLPALFQETLEIFRPAAMQKKINLRFDVDAKLPEIAVGDPAQLRRILANLVGNAVKFTQHGEVVARARHAAFAAGIRLDLACRSGGHRRWTRPRPCAPPVPALRARRGRFPAHRWRWRRRPRPGNMPQPLQADGRRHNLRACAKPRQPVRIPYQVGRDGQGLEAHQLRAAPWLCSLTPCAE